MIRTVAALAALLICLGCTRTSVTEPPVCSASPADDELKLLISHAASISGKAFDAIMTGATAPIPEMIDNHPLTVLFLVLMDKAGKMAPVQDVTVLMDPAQPAVLVKALKPRYSPHASVIWTKYITALTRKRSGDTLAGTVSFQAPGVFKGKVGYLARLTGGLWQVVEFRLPLTGSRTVLNSDGKWRVGPLTESAGP
jgi:hypothetical protein